MSRFVQVEVQLSDKSSVRTIRANGMAM